MKVTKNATQINTSKYITTEITTSNITMITKVNIYEAITNYYQ